MARVRFRGWRGARPFWAGVWALVGGVVMLYPPVSALQVVLSGNGVWPGLTIGGLVIISALMLWFDLRLVHFLGSVIIFLSLSIAGGALALAWEPPLRPTGTR
ncbi:MAG: hypothetical protein E6J45_12935 [Chloroflexi bacterium]|nr:MAG: hypothetical protein E6J45_12935 [Chloroflexota bacterium]